MERAFQDIHLFTWNYQDHDLSCLADFPDSATFYRAEWEKPSTISSILYLATCNRIEIYLETKQRKIPFNLEDVLALFENSPVYPGLSKHTPEYRSGLDAVRHLFQVAAGLKSMALGETQITGQLKRDFAEAKRLSYVSPFLMQMMQKVFESQKKIRTQTQIGQNPISLLSLLEKEIEVNNGLKLAEIKNVAIGGTGDMAQKTLRHFINKGLRNFLVIRSDVTRELPAEFRAITESNQDISVQYINWADFYNFSSNGTIDLFLTSTSVQNYILNSNDLTNLKNKKILREDSIIVDLGVPQNIEVSEDDNTHRIINLNSLLKQSKINKNLRGMHYREALPIIEKAIHVFWMDYIYSKNPELVSSVLKQVESESREEWSDLLMGPLKTITEKQKRVIIDYMKKQEKRALRTHKELFIDMLTVGNVEKELSF